MRKRKLLLSDRKEGTRDKNIPSIVRFELNEIKKHYYDSVSAIQNMFVLVEQLNAGNSENQAKDIMRSQIVFLVGAFDFYMHEITKLGLSKIFDGEWEQTPKYTHISVPMNVLNDALKAGEDSDWFVEFINEQFSTITIVSYENVKDQMNLLGLSMQLLADDAFYDINSSEKTIDKLKNRLNGLFHRRNIIAHQADRKHANAEMYDIERETVEGYISDVNKIIDAISDQIARK